jgi:hypothetical protein
LVGRCRALEILYLVAEPPSGRRDRATTIAGPIDSRWDVGVARATAVAFVQREGTSFDGDQSPNRSTRAARSRRGQQIGTTVPASVCTDGASGPTSPPLPGGHRDAP